MVCGVAWRDLLPGEGTKTYQFGCVRARHTCVLCHVDRPQSLQRVFPGIETLVHLVKLLARIGGQKVQSPVLGR